MIIDSDHAGDKKLHRSKSGFMTNVNTAMVQWYTNKQSTVETSVFGSEFVTIQGADALKDLRCKLRVMDIPMLCPSYIY